MTTAVNILSAGSRRKWWRCDDMVEFAANDLLCVWDVQEGAFEDMKHGWLIIANYGTLPRMTSAIEQLHYKVIVLLTFRRIMQCRC